MSEINSFPNNRNVYVGAEPLMRWFHGRTSGVWGEENGLTVSAVADKMQVTVSDGNGWFANENADGIAWWVDTEAMTGSKLTLDVPTADGALDRIDRVIVTWETTNYVTLPVMSILKGTAAANPVPPALTNNSAQRQLSIARIRVRAATLSITNADITDERLDASVCGLVTDQAKIDTTMIQKQVGALIDAIEKELTSVTQSGAYDLKPIRVENVAIAPSSFGAYTPEDDEEHKLQNLGYTYRAAVAVEGVLSSMVPYLTLSLGDVDECGASIANQFKCYVGGVYVYADSVPSASVNALTIECRKAVS